MQGRNGSSLAATHPFLTKLKSLIQTFGYSVEGKIIRPRPRFTIEKHLCLILGFGGLLLSIQGVNVRFSGFRTVSANV